MTDKKTVWNVAVQLLLIVGLGYLIWQGVLFAERLAKHEAAITKVQESVLTIDTNGKKVQDDVKGLAKLIQAPAVYHQYYTSTVTGAASYGERETDPVTGKPTGAQIKGKMTMGDLLFDWNGKKYSIPSNVVENGWLENGQFRFEMTAKNEVKVKANKGPSLDFVLKGGVGTNAIQEQMKPYASAELEFRIPLFK